MVSFLLIFVCLAYYWLLFRLFIYKFTWLDILSDFCRLTVRTAGCFSFLSKDKRNWTCVSFAGDDFDYLSYILGRFWYVLRQ